MPDRPDSRQHPDRAASVDATPLPEGTYLDAGVPLPAARALFAAARAYHQARPWRVLGEARPLEIEVPEHAAVRVAVLGADGAGVGLALVTDDVADATASSGEAAGAPGAGALTLTFAARDDVPAPLAEEARAAKWPLAGAQAFPLAMRRAEGGEPLRYVDAAEAGLLVVVARAVAAFCGRHARVLRAGEDVASGEAVESVEGERVVVRLRTLPERPDGGVERASGRAADGAAGAESADATGPSAAASEAGVDTDGVSASGGYVLELDRLRTMTTTLRGAKATVQRLRWSFFRAGDARHAQNQPAHERALARFLEWAIFAAPIPPDGRTLAQRAIDEAPDLPPSERARLHAIAQPRYSVYVVEDVELNVGLTVRDTVDDGVFRVRERRATPQLSPGQLLLGPLFPDAAGGFVLGGSCSGYGERDGQELPSLPPGTRNDEFAPALEQELHGASTNWIEEIGSLAELRSVYEEFAAALRATHTRLPAIARLQRLVREHESPAEALRVAATVDWWSAHETTVFVGLLQRLQRLTPRPSPDAPASSDEPDAAQPRAQRARSGRKSRRRR